jgi:molybdopterin adenylyltransferase
MQEVVTKELPAFGELTRQTNPLEVPTAILSRQTIGIRGLLALRHPPQAPSVRDLPRRVFRAISWIDLIGAEQIEMSAPFNAANRPIGPAVR